MSTKKGTISKGNSSSNHHFSVEKREFSGLYHHPKGKKTVGKRRDDMNFFPENFLQSE